MGCSPSSPGGGRKNEGVNTSDGTSEKQDKQNHKLDFVQGNSSNRLMTIMNDGSGSSLNWRNMAFRRPQQLNVIAAFPREDSLLNCIQNGSDKLKWKLNLFKITSTTNIGEWLNLNNTSPSNSTSPPSSPCAPPTIDLLLLDYRQPKSLPWNTLEIIKSLKAQNFVLVVVAFVKKSFFEKSDNAVNSLLESGIDKVEIDHGVVSTYYWSNALSHLEKSLVDTAYKLMMVQTLVTTLDHCHDMVQITDSRHRIQFVNQAYEKFLGCTKADVVGTDFIEHQTKLGQLPPQQIPPLSPSPKADAMLNHVPAATTTTGVGTTGVASTVTTTATAASPTSHFPNVPTSTAQSQSQTTGGTNSSGTYFNYSLQHQQQLTRTLVQIELGRGKPWEGHYIYNRDTSAPLVLNTKVIPVQCSYGTCNRGGGYHNKATSVDLLQFNNWNCTSYIYISEPPTFYSREKSLSHEYGTATGVPITTAAGSTAAATTSHEHTSHNPIARGSLKSLRKASYDIKSISNDGSVLRRQSLAKLHSLTIEAPITRVINIIAAAQQNCPLYIAQALEKVLEILKTTELYSPQFFEGGRDTIKVKSDDPLTTDLLGALLSQGPKPGTTVRRSSNENTSRLAPRPSLPDIAEAPSQLQRILETESRWDFDVILLEEITEKRPLVWTGMAIFSRFGVAQTLRTDDTSIRNWLTLIEANYHSPNTYHNSTHAADVLQATAYFLTTERLKTFMEPIDEVIALIAAAVHDVDHPGKNSTYLTNSGNELALLYNDISVLESHHSAFTFKLTLSDSRVNIFKNLDTDTYKVVRSGIIDMVLATEMTKHFEHFSKFVNVFTKPLLNNGVKDGGGDGDQSPVTGGASRSSSGAYLGSNSNLNGSKSMDGGSAGSLTPSGSAEPDITTLITPENIILIKRMLIKCADISNPARPKRLCVEWAKRIAEEYFRQTDEEISRGLPPVMPMFERDTCSIPKSQTGFIDYFVQDMFEAWDAFLDVPEVIDHMRTNYDYWKDLDRQGIQSAGQVDAYNRLSGGN